MAAAIIALLLNALTPWHDWRSATDLRNWDGYRYTTRCVGRYQIPETWMCLEIAAPPRGIVAR